MNPTFILVGLIAAWVQSRVLGSDRRLAQESIKNTQCLVLSRVHPAEAGANPGWLNGHWGLRIRFIRPESEVNRRCIDRDIASATSALFKTEYIPLVTDSAFQLMVGRSFPEYSIIWFEEIQPLPGQPSPPRFIEHVYKLPSNHFISIFGPHESTWVDLDIFPGKVVKHSPSFSYQVNPDFLADKIRRAVGGLSLNEGILGAIRHKLQLVGVTEVSFEARRSRGWVEYETENPEEEEESEPEEPSD